MSILVDTASLIPGAIVCGSPGLGVPFATIRANTGGGDAGPGVQWGDWDGAADDTVEIRIEIERWPATGTFILEEDGRGSYAGTADYAIGRVYADGVDKGTKVISFFGGAPDAGSTVSLAGLGGLASTVAYGLPTLVPMPPAGPLAAQLSGIGGLASVARFGVPQLSFMPPLVTVGGEPVTVNEAKQAARLELDEHELDADLATLITAAREQAEHITARYYLRRVVVFELRAWPSTPLVLPAAEPSGARIQTWNGSAWQDWPDAEYEVASVGAKTLIAPALGATWPPLVQRALAPAIRVHLTVGPASPAEVKACVKLYIKAQVAAWVDTPAAQRVSQQLVPNPLFASLLDAERLWA